MQLKPIQTTSTSVFFSPIDECKPLSSEDQTIHGISERFVLVVFAPQRFRPCELFKSTPSPLPFPINTRYAPPLPTALFLLSFAFFLMSNRCRFRCSRLPAALCRLNGIAFLMKPPAWRHTLPMLPAWWHTPPMPPVWRHTPSTRYPEANEHIHGVPNSRGVGQGTGEKYLLYPRRRRGGCDGLATLASDQWRVIGTNSCKKQMQTEKCLII